MTGENSKDVEAPLVRTLTRNTTLYRINLEPTSGHTDIPRKAFNALCDTFGLAMQLATAFCEDHPQYRITDIYIMPNGELEILEWRP